MMPGLPDKIGAIRDAVKRKSVALAGMKSVTSVTSFFNRGPSSQSEHSNGSPPTSGRPNSNSIDYDDDEMIMSPQNRASRGASTDRHSGSMTRVEKPTTLVGSLSYTEPPEPYLPAGGLLESATKNVQAKMIEMLDIYHDSSPCDDPTIECSVFLSRNVAQADRVVVFIGDSVGSPAGIWSSKLCVRSGSEGGGIHHGSLGSMLPYLLRARDDLFGIVVFDDIFHMPADSDASMMQVAIARLITGWRDHIDTSQASHAFIVCYGEGGRLLVDSMRQHLPEMRRLLSGIAFIQSTHRVDSTDTYLLRKTMAQWAVSYASSMEPQLARLKHKEHEAGCIVLSAGYDGSDVEVLQSVLHSVFSAFRARYAGFRTSNISTGMEKNCYICKQAFNMRRWRRHCRTCQMPVCEKCSSMETTKLEGSVRLCLTCRALPSLVSWSRPRAVRLGEKESVFVDSTVPGKMSVNDFELVSVIGKGACGTVLLVQKKDNAKLYAMKVLKKDWVMNKDLVTQTMAERRILQEANHPYIVQLRFAFQNNDKLYMVMDYYSGGSLRQVLRRRGRFSIKRARFYLAEVLLAIAHLHASNILYRDLKLENIVLTADGNVACTDFGLSKEEVDKETGRASSFVGTCEYLAPEIIMKQPYGTAVDWWAFGILMYEMIQGDSPFRHQNPAILFEKILSDEPIFSERFTPEAKDLVQPLMLQQSIRPPYDAAPLLLLLGDQATEQGPCRTARVWPHWCRRDQGP
ncbi:AGC/AKT protein kinase, variant [Aphanomyces invadans]|uniref:non-specific serine/threonine protein kinase n=1 Tax=Aphanomyces invadans TaxID=157072 RepID=A0A024UGH2_9STRA|nr:AGC/AKT protein kinase, variant [Aphanomyces invadans]ETW04947.1 AGC/AKT protein kinase, variant [Aphanomyces invadans]|eukprot:XP_008866384.1 AGC/AKT protein kinase, variant [Aphanomyces invadans]